MITAKKAIIWTISGSDCSGGAGIAADIKTGHALGVEVCHLITANTVQNSQQLVSVNPVDISLLDAQWNVLKLDKTPLAIKVGLLANDEQIHWLCEKLTSFKKENPRVKVIYDPVGQASVGGSFSTLSFAALKTLFAFVDIITPNLHEAQTLTQGLAKAQTHAKVATTVECIKWMAEALVSLGCNTAIIKGGHFLTADKHTQDCVDYCLHTLVADDSSRMSQDESIVYGLRTPKIITDYSHGGGCSFASALASFSAQGHLVRDAFTLTKAFMQQGFQKQVDQVGYYGAFEQIPPSNISVDIPIKNQPLFPQIETDLTQKYADLKAFSSLGLQRGQTEKLGLYPVIDSLAWLKRLLPLNLNIIQLRVKHKTESELEDIIAAATSLCAGSNTRLFINDYWRLAIKYGAYGVHIGQEDIVDADLTQIQAAGLRLGISTHGCYEFLLAQQLKPSYLAIGAIYPTNTKDMTGQIQGIDNLIHTLSLATDIPVVAIGGINHTRASEVWATGVDSLAVVTAITEANSPEASVTRFQTLLS